MSMVSKKKSRALQTLEAATGGPLTLGKLIQSIRLGEEMTQPEFAKILGISKSHLNDIEKGRKLISPDRADRFAKVLKYSEERFVALSLQDIVNQAGLRFYVNLRVA